MAPTEVAVKQTQSERHAQFLSSLEVGSRIRINRHPATVVASSGPDRDTLYYEFDDRRMATFNNSQPLDLVFLGKNTVTLA